MNKHLGHLLVLAALVGLGNGLGGGSGGGTGGDGGLGGGLGGSPGEGAGAGSVGGPSNGGASGSTRDNSRSGLFGNGGHSAPKNTSLGFGSSSRGGGGGAGGSAGGPEGPGGHLPSGGPESPGGAGTTGSSYGTPRSSSSSANSGSRVDLAEGFGGGSSGGNSYGGFGGPGGAAFDFGGFGSESMFGNFHSGFSSPSVGGGAVTGGSAGGADGFDGDTFSGGENGFGSGLGTGWGPDGRAESSFPTRGAGFGYGRPGGLSAWSAGGNPYGSEGVYGFGGIEGGSEVDNFDSGYASSSTGESPDFGSSTADSSNGPSSSLADVPGGSGHRRLLSRFWQGGLRARGPLGLGHRRRKTDPRLAAAVALGAVAGVAALGSLSAGIAAAMHARRRSGVVGLGRARRGCVSGDCHRKRRSIPTSKVPAEILNGISMHFERL